MLELVEFLEYQEQIGVVELAALQGHNDLGDLAPDELVRDVQAAEQAVLYVVVLQRLDGLLGVLHHVGVVLLGVLQLLGYLDHIQDG